MGSIKLQIIDIPLEEIKGIDDMFFRQIQMKGDKVMKKFSKQFEVTRKNFFDNVTCQGMFKSVPIVEKKDNTFFMEDKTEINSEMLSNLFDTSEEIIMCAIALHGFEKLEEEAGDGMLSLFMDGWGSAAVECAHVWIKEKIQELVDAQGLHMTASWCPGQHNVDIRLQRPLFDSLKPEQINIVLSKTYMMDPKKSVTSFIGIGTDSSATDLRACDFCIHRETCPSAYV